jgi:alpha-galactosidase
MVTGPKPLEVAVVNLPYGLEYDTKTHLIRGRVEQSGEYEFEVLVRSPAGKLKHVVKLIVDLGIASNPPARGWISESLDTSEIRLTNLQQGCLGLINSGLADLGFDWVVIGDGWQGNRMGKYHALHPNDKFKDLPYLIPKCRNLGLKIGLWMTTARKSPLGYLGTNADSWTGTLSDEYSDYERGKFNFAAEDIKLWNEWHIDGLWLKGNDLTTTDALTYYRQMAKSAPTKLLCLDHNVSTPMALKLQLGIVQQQSFSPKQGQNWFMLRQQVLALTRPTDNSIWQKLYASSSVSGYARRLQFGLYALFGLPLWLQDPPNRLLNERPNDLYWITNQEVLALQRLPGPPAKCVEWEHNKGVWVRQLANGKTIIGWVNFSSTMQTIPYKINGRYNIRDLWRHEDIGDADGEISCEVAPYSLELWELRPKLKKK